MWKEKSLYRCITKNCQSMSHLGRKNDLIILAFCQSRTKRLDMDKLLHRFASDKRRLRLVVQIRSNCLSLCVSTLYAGIVTFLFTLIINACLHSWFVSNDSKCPKIPKFLSGNPEHDQSSYFYRGPNDFCWGPAPVGPTLVTGLRSR